MIRVYLEPRVVIQWQDFINSKPRFSIALDGYVKGPPRVLIEGPYANFNHHEGVARIATRSTCAQVYYYIRLGLLDTFQKNGEPNARVYINDVDQDVCLSCWLLKNSAKLEGLRFDNVLVQLILFEDILDASAGAYPINPDNPQIHRQAWIYEPYTQARTDGSIYNMSKKEMKDILWSVCARIDAAIDGRSGEIELDTRFEKIGGGPGWQLIDEKGPYARTKLFSEKFFGSTISTIKSIMWRGVRNCPASPCEPRTDSKYSKASPSRSEWSYSNSSIILRKDRSVAGSRYGR